MEDFHKCAYDKRHRSLEQNTVRKKKKTEDKWNRFVLSVVMKP